MIELQPRFMMPSDCSVSHTYRRQPGGDGSSTAASIGGQQSRGRWLTWFVSVHGVCAGPFLGLSFMSIIGAFIMSTAVKVCNCFDDGFGRGRACMVAGGGWGGGRGGEVLVVGGVKVLLCHYQRQIQQ